MKVTWQELTFRDSNTHKKGMILLMTEEVCEVVRLFKKIRKSYQKAIGFKPTKNAHFDCIRSIKFEEMGEDKDAVLYVLMDCNFIAGNDSFTAKVWTATDGLSVDFESAVLELHDYLLGIIDSAK